MSNNLKQYWSTSQEAMEDIISKVVASLSGQFIAIALVLWCFHHFDGINAIVIGWTAILITVLAIRYIIYKRMRALLSQPYPQQRIAKNCFLRFHANVLLTGILWGGGFFYFVQIAPDNLQLISMAITAMLGGGGILTLASSFLAYVLFAVPMISLLGLSFFLLGSEYYFVFTMASFIGLFYLLYTALAHAHNFNEMTRHSKRVQQTQLDLIHALGRAAEYRDEETGEHTQRMSYACYLVALKLGIHKERAQRIEKAASMHDIGKIGIPDKILLKPGKLTDEERAIMQTHTEIELRILEDSESETIQIARTIIEGHHEHWDGNGYPHQREGEDIPIEARIAAICDVFDALISERPYKQAWDYDKALQYLRNNRGKHFDPQIVDAFEASYSRIVEFASAHKDRKMS